MPTDTVPTVTRLTPEPRGNGVAASSRRRGGWLAGRVNTCERLLTVVQSDQPQMLRGLSQHGTVAGRGCRQSPSMDTQRYRRTESTSPVLGNLVERGKPVSLLPQGRSEGRQGNGGRCGYGGGKKRRPSCQGTETGCNITRRASALTALRCLGTRTTEESLQKVWQMAVDWVHWCSLPRQGIDCGAVSYSQQVVELLTGPSYGLRDA
jgi:hypothetical protein